MRDLDPLLDRIATLLDQPSLPPLTPWVVSTTPVDRPVETVRRLLTEGRLRVDSPTVTGRWDEIAEKPRPRPPRPFPPSESAALARRAEHDQPRPRGWFGRWRRG